MATQSNPSVDREAHPNQVDNISVSNGEQRIGRANKLLAWSTHTLRYTIPHSIPFYGRMYRAWSKFLHKRGYHYAPRRYPPEPHTPRPGLGGQIITEWYHWCQWCGLRGTTIEIKPEVKKRLAQQLPRTKANTDVQKNAKGRTQ